LNQILPEYQFTLHQTTLYPADGGSMFLRNGGIQPPHYTA